MTTSRTTAQNDEARPISALNRRITTRTDVESYVNESLENDREAFDDARFGELVDAVIEQGDVEYGVTTTDDIESRIDHDDYWALVERIATA